MPGSRCHTPSPPAGFTYQPAELCGLDRAAKEVLVVPLYAADGRLLVLVRRFANGALIIVVGSQTDDFGIPVVAEYCRSIDLWRQANAFSVEICIPVLQFLAQREELSIAIVGGGATGFRSLKKSR